MGTELTKAQIKRDDFLRMLGYNPGEALRYWKRLKTGEPMVVVTYMSTAYGVTFAQHFKAEADKHRRPDLLITLTNLASVTPQSLTAKGYKFQLRVGNSDLQIWVNPTGQQVWYIPPSKAPSVPPLPVKTEDPVHPDVEELRIYVAQYTARKNDMIRKARDIEAKYSALSKVQYDKLRADWWREYEGWDEELDDIFSEVIPEMADDLTRQEKEMKAAEIEKLRAIRVSWPADAMNPRH